MTGEIKMRDVLKSAFKETPDSLRNAVNNAIAEAVNNNHENRHSFEKEKSAILPSTQK